MTAARKALVVRGGWDSHMPVETTGLFIPFLEENGFEVLIEEGSAVYADVMATTDLIVQANTMTTIEPEEMAGLRAAVIAGTGMAGWHGGIADSYRNTADYLHMIGGQFAHHADRPPVGSVAPADYRARHLDPPVGRGPHLRLRPRPPHRGRRGPERPHHHREGSPVGSALTHDEDAMTLGIIGVGKISEQYFAAFESLLGVRLVAVADLDLDRARTVAEAQGVDALSVDDLIADPRIQTVLNLTIPAAHAEVDLRVLEAGKHIYGEKLLALSPAEEKSLRVGSSPDTVLGTGIQTARQVLDAGTIGRPVAANAFWGAPGHELWHPASAFYYQPGGGRSSTWGRTISRRSSRCSARSRACRACLSAPTACARRHPTPRRARSRSPSTRM